MKRVMDRMSITLRDEPDGTLYVEDEREGLTIIRENSGEELYDITVIIDKYSFHIPDGYGWIVNWDQDFGIVFEGITHQKWEELSKAYVRARIKARRGLVEPLMELMDRELYFPIDVSLWLSETLCDGVPIPGDSKKEQKQCLEFFNREISEIQGIQYDRENRKSIGYLAYLYRGCG